MLADSHDLPQKSLQIKLDDKFSNKLLSRETFTNSSSSRIYDSVSPCAIPFTWESQPGTPKNTIPSTSLPPLTPPPSYLSKNSMKNPTKSASKSTIFNVLLPRLSLGKTKKLRSTSPSSSSSSSSSTFSPSSSIPTSPARSSDINSQVLSPRSSFSRGDDEFATVGLPTSTSRFKVMRLPGCPFRWCYSMITGNKSC